MNRKGYTLVELVVVVAIISTLLTISVINLAQWQRRKAIETQTKQLYSDMMSFRHNAMANGVTYRLTINSPYSITFSRHSSEGDIGGTQMMQKNFVYPLTRSTWTDPANNIIEFNSRGIMDDATTKTLCVYSKYEPAADSIVIAQSRIVMGKLNDQGSGCGQTNITVK